MNQINTTQMDFTAALQARLERLQRWRPLIEKALRRARSLVTFTDLVQSICQGQRFLFDNGNSFAIVQLDMNPSGNALYIYVAGGDYKALYELEETVVQFGRHMNCCRLSTSGRKGFLRRNRPNGWEPTNQIMFVKEII